MNAFDMIGRKSQVVKALRSTSVAMTNNTKRELAFLKEHGFVRRRSSAVVMADKLNNLPNGEYRK